MTDSPTDPPDPKVIPFSQTEVEVTTRRRRRSTTHSARPRQGCRRACCRLLARRRLDLDGCRHEEKPARSSSLLGHEGLIEVESPA